MATQQVQGLVAALLNKRDIHKWVLDKSGGYNVASTIIDIINRQSGSHRSTNVGGKLETYKRGKNNVVQPIATVTQSGNNIILTFVDPTYNKFIPKDVVMDTNYVLGRVISAAPGTVTLQNYPDASVAMSATTQFQVGTLCKIMANISGIYGSLGTANRIFTPFPTDNYPSVVRASYNLTGGDKIETYVTTANNSPFFYWQNEMDMLNTYFKNLEFKYIFDNYSAPVNTSLEGEITGNRGMRQGIIQDGVYMPLASAPTGTDLQDMLTALANRNTANGQRFTCMCGRSFLANIQNNLTQPYIQYAGTRNTFGGEAVKGLNVMTYAIADVFVDFIVLPLLNDTELSEPTAATNARGTKWSNTAFFLNLEPIPAVGNMTQTTPAIRKFHFGEQEISYRGVNGMISFESDSLGGPGKYVSTASDADAAGIHLIGKQGIDGEWYRCGMMELVS